ncbi:hypothetical protein C0Q70_10328 [Pomacea canaliculata]|uniref:Uncharacterized protein n=1 Tax=Pomacea canaliculata TaxID=400727 RepID=A0A2T7PCB3_POMCA|nr:hypothetical protein C0Q70_10328 [Pomacea canaliculata]
MEVPPGQEPLLPARSGWTHYTVAGLDKLVLQENDLDDDSFRLLADAVRRGVFKYLRHLNLIHNPVTESGAVYLADVLHCLPRLQELLLQYSNISPQGALRLSQAALNLPDMTVLDLSESSCMTSDDARDVLREVIAAVHEGGVVAGHGVAFVAVEGDLEDFLLPQAEEAEISVPHRDVVQEDGERIAQKGEPAIITTTATEQPFTERVASPQQFTRQNAIVNIEVGENLALCHVSAAPAIIHHMVREAVDPDLLAWRSVGIVFIHI